MSERNTFNQVNQQETSAYISGTKDMPTVLIDRTGGNITVGRLDKNTKKVHFSENGQDWEKTASMEALSDGYQEVLAAKLAGRALRGVGIVEVAPSETPVSRVEFGQDGLIKVPDSIRGAQGQPKTEAIAREAEPVIDPFDELDESVKAEVLSYRRVVRNKWESEQAKDFAQAAEDGRTIWSVGQSLSPAAKTFLNIR